MNERTIAPGSYTYMHMYMQPPVYCSYVLYVLINAVHMDKGCSKRQQWIGVRTCAQALCCRLSNARKVREFIFVKVNCDYGFNST